MLHRFYRQIYRDRRRLGFSGTLLVAATLLGYDYVPDVAPFMPTELLVFLALILAMPIISLYAPRLRYLIELTAVSNLTFVLIGRAFPDSNFYLSNPNVNFISATILYALTIAFVEWLSWGRWSDQLRRPGPLTLSAKAVSHLSARELWFGLVPTPGHIDECADPDVVSIEYADGNHRTVRLINWSPPGPHRETLLHFLDIKPLSYARFRTEERGLRRYRGFEGESTFHIDQVGDRLCVTLLHEMDHLPLRRMLRGWLDDTVGRMLDLRLNGIE